MMNTIDVLSYFISLLFIVYGTFDADFLLFQQMTQFERQWQTLIDNLDINM